MTTTTPPDSTANPIAAPLPPWDGHARTLFGGGRKCVKDGVEAGPDDDPQAWFASHLETVGAPDYVVGFERDWRELVTDESGNLDLDKIARELWDYSRITEEVSKTYDELSNGRLSKPNTATVHIVEAVEQRYAEAYATDLLREIDDLDEPITREALVAIADGWSEGASEEYEQAKARRAGATA